MHSSPFCLDPSINLVAVKTPTSSYLVTRQLTTLQELVKRRFRFLKILSEFIKIEPNRHGRCPKKETIEQ